MDESDALLQLEERIRKTVEIVAVLRSERDAALTELAELRKGSADSAKLRAELDSMQKDRLQVRGRIEKLLGQIDQLG